MSGTPWCKIHTGAVVNCNIVIRVTGVYSDSGYVVLYCSAPSNIHLKVSSLIHCIDWAFNLIDFMDIINVSFSSPIERVCVKATWATMPLYCHYCHSYDRTLLDYALPRRPTVCYLCNEERYITRVCPRKNTGSSKKHKIPAQTINITVQPTDISNAVLASTTVADLSKEMETQSPMPISCR